MAATTAPPIKTSKPTVTTTMSEWAAGLEFEQLSADAIYQAKRFLLDTLAAGIAGAHTEVVDAALAAAQVSVEATTGTATL